MSSFVILLLTFLVSIVPIIELKGAIPMGVGLAVANAVEMSPWAYFAAAFVGSCLPAVLILLWLKPVLHWLGTTGLFHRLAEKLDAHFVKKAAKVEDKAKRKEDAAKARAEEEGKVWSEAEYESMRKKRARAAAFAKYFSVFLFVAIPLPGTGVWTGSAIAVFLGTKFRYALPAVVLGNLVAGLIIMLVTLFVGSSIFGISFT